MKGAREYAQLFTTGQYGRLYIVSGDHARGRTFRLFVLPKDEMAIPNGSQNPPLNKDAVEVYGVVSGQPGWTEEYGWKRKGQWVHGFAELVAQRKAEKELKAEVDHQLGENRRAHENERIKGLLANY